MRTCLLGIFLLACPALAALNTDKLSDADIARVKDLLAKLEPLIKSREAEESLATLTFEQLYAPLNDEERAFLEQFKNLDGPKLGVSIPFRGIATGKEELVVIKDQQITLNNEPYTIPPQYLPPEPYRHYLEMMAAMEQDLGRRLYVESGYRSSAYQLYLFVYYLKNHDYSIAETVGWVALPGYSEHGAPAFQAIDFISQDGVSGEEHPEDFEDLKEYRWLLENARRFGFVLSYPRGASGITFEPWHWRFEAANLSGSQNP
jgi:D-alanyl-D-alanine carboxypeptidase